MWSKCQNPKYEVSTSGKVRNATTLRILHQYTDRYGYKYVSFYEGGAQKKQKVHRLVAAAFLGDVAGYEIDHIDTVRTNNSIDNLRIVTRKENTNNPATIKRLVACGKKYSTLYGKPIVCKGGRKFKSIIEASRKLMVPRSRIQYHLKNGTGVYKYE